MFNKSKSKDTNRSINCEVSNCNYNDCEEGKCTLNEVLISCQCDGEECTNTSSTICQSFASSGGIITDNEYEVASEFDEDIKEEEY